LTELSIYAGVLLFGTRRI